MFDLLKFSARPSTINLSHDFALLIVPKPTLSSSSNKATDSSVSTYSDTIGKCAECDAC